MSIKAKIAAELAERVKGGDGIAMDYASRMQRAKEQGFDTTRRVYHGTAEDFESFDPDRAIGTQFWSTTDKAAIEAGEVGAQGKGYIKEMFTNIKNPAGWGEYDRLGIDEIRGRGYDGIELKEGDESTFIAFKPNQYRDVNAAFDPAKKNSSNLLASMGAGTAAGAGLMASDDSEAGVVSGIFSKGSDLARKADFITNMQAVEKIPPTDEGFSLQESWLNYIDDPIANKEAESLDLTLSELSDKYKKDIAMQVNDPSININSVLDNYSKISGNFDSFLKNAQGLNNEAAFQAKTLLNQRGRATLPGMIGGTGAGLTSVALADAYKDYMAKDKALADESLFNFGRMVEQAPENFLNSVQDVASLSGLGDLVRGFALPVATTVGGIDEFNQVNDFVSEFEQPQTRAVNYGMNAITDAILPIYEDLSPYISEDYNAIGSSEWPDDYRNPKYRGALNLAHDISRGTYSALTGTTRYLEDKLKE